MSGDIIKSLKRDILRAAYQAGEGHIASAFSCLDVLYVLYTQVLNENQDHIILSKGHASLALYAVLAHKGKMPVDWPDKFGTIYGGHPVRGCHGIEASTGSLGHGMPIAVGLAMAKKAKKEPGNVYCIVGDGECNEGTIWESALVAGHHQLDNLFVIVDNNHSSDRHLHLTNLADKFGSFGWCVVSNAFGHEHTAIHAALNHHWIYEGFASPRVIITETVKGKGVKAMETEPHAWHHRAPTATEYKQFMEELQ